MIVVSVIHQVGPAFCDKFYTEEISFFFRWKLRRTEALRAEYERVSKREESSPFLIRTVLERNTQITTTAGY